MACNQVTRDREAVERLLRAGCDLWAQVSGAPSTERKGRRVNGFSSWTKLNKHGFPLDHRGCRKMTIEEQRMFRPPDFYGLGSNMHEPSKVVEMNSFVL